MDRTNGIPYPVAVTDLLSTELPPLNLPSSVWDLRPLVSDTSEDLPPFDEAAGPAVSLGRLLDLAERLAVKAEAWRGRIGEADADQLAEVLTLASRVHDLVGRAGSYAQMDATTDSHDEAKGALMVRMSERATDIGNRLRFVDLEWAAVTDEHAAPLVADPKLGFCSHYLHVVRAARPYLLSESEERLLAEKSVTGSTAWTRLYDEQLGSLTVDLGEGPVPYEMIFPALMSSERPTRKAAAEAFTAALAPGLRTRGYIYNTLMADKAHEDKLRGYPTWVSARNLGNQASDASVSALIEAVSNRFDIARRWYSTKANLLGLEKLADYDRFAPLGGVSEPMIDWSDAVHQVVGAFSSFSPTMASHAAAFFRDQRVHAPIGDGKRGGAYCSPNVPSTHPHVFVNYSGTRNDVLTLAHELGHGVHFELSRPQGIYHHSVPLTVAETASVFAEEVTFGRLLDVTTDPAQRLSLLAEHVQGHIATVFRQVAMWKFEDRCHTSRRTEGELSIDSLNEHWAQSQAELLGDTVEITPGYRTWWSYVPHFIHTPGYVYAYAFGQLLALSVYRRFQDAGPSFVARYENMLSLGGSVSPEQLARSVDCDLGDPSFWDAGLDLVSDAVDDAVMAANASGSLSKPND
jgi:oligoendopeptidase F